MRLVYRKKMLENRHFLIGIFQHFTTVADCQVSYIAITELAYILLAWQERLNTDDRTLGDLFYSFTNSLPDITFICALVYLISVLKCSGNEFIEDKIDQFMHTILSNVQNIISRVL